MVAEMEVKVNYQNLGTEHAHSKLLHDTVELLVEIARVWHMNDDEEEVEEHQEASEVSWTDDEWHDLDSPSLGETSNYTNMMGGMTKSTDQSYMNKEQLEKEREEEGFIYTQQGVTRAEKMKRMRAKMRKCAEQRKESMLKPVDGEICVERVKRKAQTARGQRYLKAGEVDNRLVQDKSKNQVVVGSDVEALYPSLQDTQVAEIIFNAIMETKVGFEGVNHQEGARYIVLNCTEQECRLGPLGRVSPRRRFKKETRPGVTGAGPLGAEVGDQEQWKFPRVTLTEREKRLIIATVMRIAVLTLFQTHTYSFGGKYYLQKEGGPIGLRSTCCIARLVMLWWDEELLKVLVKNNIITEAHGCHQAVFRDNKNGMEMDWS